MRAFFDMHCDLPTKIYSSNENLLHNSAHWDIKKCPCRDFVQFFACYIDKNIVSNPFEFTNNVLDNFVSKIDENKDYISLVKNYSDITKNKKQNKISAFLSIEGGEALEGDINNLTIFHQKGVRMMSFTWNYENELGYGVMDGKENEPLKKLGISALKKMEELNIIPDVSHLNMGGFYSVAEHSYAPIVASHSNSRKICNHVRNLTDEQIEIIIKKRGLIGVNLHSPFLSANENTTIKDVLNHIDHFLSLGAEDSIAFGCDFDGTDKLPNKINDISSLENIVEEMQKNHFSNEIIAKICYKNAQNLIKAVLL